MKHRPRIGPWIWLASALLLFASPARALPLFLTLENAPDIFSSDITVSYNAATDQLSANGFAWTLDDDGVGAAHTITGGTFALSANINGTGGLVSGTLSIGGTVATLGFGSSPLLTGTLTAFGFPVGGGDPLEFLFTVTGGAANNLYGGNGATGGVILTQSGFLGSFASNWGNLDQGLADTGVPAPEPATALLVLLGLGAAAGLRASRRS